VVSQQPTPLPTDVINNFETDSVYCNPDLLGYQSSISAVTQLAPNGIYSVPKPGFFAINSYGGPPGAPNTFNSNFVVPNTVPDATDSSNFAIHVGWPTGPLTLIATGIGNGYESDQLTCYLQDNPSNLFYDATPFLDGGNGGIAFYYNIPADDTNTNRAFQIATINTTAAFNHFQCLLPNGPSGGWQAVTFTWKQFNCPFGSCNGALTTTGPVGNMNHIPFIQWQFSDNQKGQGVTLPGGAPASPATFIYPQSGGGSVTVVYGPETFTDFWIDNVQFIP
jgi:hypothetical protein